MKLKENMPKILSLFLAFVMILSLLPVSLFADGPIKNPDGIAGGDNGEGNKTLSGSNMVSDKYLGMRFSLYFAEGNWETLEEYEQNISSAKFQKLGYVDTVQRNREGLAITRASYQTVYDRMVGLSGKGNMDTLGMKKVTYTPKSMNSFGFVTSHTKKLDSGKSVTYDFKGPNKIENGFPEIISDVKDASRFIRFFTGMEMEAFTPINSSQQEKDRVAQNWNNADMTNLMKVVDVILANGGHSDIKITEEDFKNGVLKDSLGTKTGIYKLFFEPIGHLTLNRTAYAVTTRDVIAMQRYYNAHPKKAPDIKWSDGTSTGLKMISAFRTPISNYGSAVYLKGAEESVNMRGLKGTSEKFHTGFKPKEVKTDVSSDFYQSAGVGVVTGFPKGGRPGPKIIRTYVQVEDLDENNNPIFKTIEESDIKPVEFYKDGNGFTTKIPKGIDIVDFNNEKGVAYLNDIIIVSAEDISLNPSSGKTIWENTTLPENILEKDALIDGSGRLQLNPDAKDIPAHAFGLYTSTPAFIETFKEETAACSF